jgi:hypothetical protein
MNGENVPQAGDYAPYETVSVGFECIFTGQREMPVEAGVDLDLVYNVDERGFVTMQYSLWGCFHTTTDKWNEEIRAINQMQAALGPLSNQVRRVRAHIASLVPCDNGVPVTIDEILNAIGTGDLPKPAFHPGCWLSTGTRTTQPDQVKSMRDIEAILRVYLEGQSAEKLVERYPYAHGFIERCYAWLGSLNNLTGVQKLLMDRMLLPFAFFTKRNPNQYDVYVECFKPGGRGEAIDAEISKLAGIPRIYPNYTREFKEHLESITDAQQKTIYMIAGHIANGVSELSDCHHNTFRYIERWIHAIGTLSWDIPTRSSHAESTRLGRLLFGYALGLDRWLQGIPQQFLLLDLGHIDLGFDPKNEILRVYAYLGEDHTPEKEWLAACLWYTLTLMPPASLYKWGHRHKALLEHAAGCGISVCAWMDAKLVALEGGQS